MGFLDKAKAAATELSAKADQALSSQGLAGPSAGGKQTDKYFRDLGVLAYLEATGRPADAGERDRIMSALQGFEGQGAMPSFALQTTSAATPWRCCCRRRCRGSTRVCRPRACSSRPGSRGATAAAAELGRRSASSAASAELGRSPSASASDSRVAAAG